MDNDIDVFICKGCGVTVSTPPSITLDKKLSGWATVKVYPNRDSYNICPKCVKKVLDVRKVSSVPKK